MFSRRRKGSRYTPRSEIKNHMLHHLEKARQRPHHERARIVFLFASAVTGVIALGWLMMLGLRFGGGDMEVEASAGDSLSGALSGFEGFFSGFEGVVSPEGSEVPVPIQEMWDVFQEESAVGGTGEEGSSPSVPASQEEKQEASPVTEISVPQEQKETSPEESAPKEPPPAFPDSL